MADTRDARFVGRSDMSDVFRDIDRLQSELRKTQAQSATTGKTMSASMIAAGDAMTKAGRSLTMKVTLPLALSAGFAAAKFLAFEKQITQTALVAGATAEQLAMLREEAMRLGVETQYTPTQAAEGMYELSSAGLSVQQVMEATGPVLEFATASTLDLGEAAAITAETMNAFGLQATDMTHITDVLVGLVQRSTFHAEELGEALKHVGVLSGQSNQSLEDVAAALTLMRNAGMPAAMSGTALVQMMRFLGAPTDIARKSIDQLGLSLINADGSMRRMPEIVAEITRGLSDANPAFAAMRAEQDQSAAAMKRMILSDLLGVEGMAAYTLMANGMTRAMVDGSEQMLQGADSMFYLADSYKTTESVTNEFAKGMKDTLGGQLKSMRGSLDALSITFSETFGPGLKQFIQTTVIPFVNSMREWVKENENLVRSLGKVLLAAGLAGPSLTAIGYAMRGIGYAAGPIQALTAKYGGLAAMLGKIPGPLVAIAALLAAMIAASPELRESLGELFGVMATAAADTFEALRPVVTTLVQAMVPVLQALARVVGFLADGVRSLLITVGPVVPWILTAVAAWWGLIKVMSLARVGMGVVAGSAAVMARATAAGTVASVGLRGALGSMAGAMNPWALGITAAVTGVIAVFSLWGAEARKAEARAKELKDSLLALGTAWDEEFAAEEMSKLVEGGQIKVLNAAGVTIEQWIEWMRKGGEGSEEFRRRLEEMIEWTSSPTAEQRGILEDFSMAAWGEVRGMMGKNSIHTALESTLNLLDDEVAATDVAIDNQYQLLTQRELAAKATANEMAVEQGYASIADMAAKAGLRAAMATSARAYASEFATEKTAEEVQAEEDRRQALRELIVGLRDSGVPEENFAAAVAATGNAAEYTAAEIQSMALETKNADAAMETTIQDMAAVMREGGMAEEALAQAILDTGIAGDMTVEDIERLVGVVHKAAVEAWDLNAALRAVQDAILAAQDADYALIQATQEYIEAQETYNKRGGQTEENLMAVAATQRKVMAAAIAAGGDLDELEAQFQGMYEQGIIDEAGLQMALDLMEELYPTWYAEYQRIQALGTPAAIEQMEAKLKKLPQDVRQSFRDSYNAAATDVEGMAEVLTEALITAEERFGDLNDLDFATLETALRNIALKIGLPVQETALLLEKLGLLDGTTVDALIQLGLLQPPAVHVTVAAPTWEYIYDPKTGDVIGRKTGDFYMYHEGGTVPGSGDVPAILRGGEMVLTADETRMLAKVIGQMGGVPDVGPVMAGDAIARSVNDEEALPQSVSYTVNNPRPRTTEESLRDIRLRQTYLGFSGRKVEARETSRRL